MLSQEVRELQNKAVNAMLDKMSSVCNEFTFKAPTGSGKTFMMAKFMDEYLAKNHNAVFIVSSLSKAKLAEQNYNKFQEYEDKGFVKNINPFLINSEDSGENALYIPTDCNVYVLPRDLYKEKSKLKGQGAFKQFLAELKNLNKQIYLIKDECHIATNKLDELVKNGNHRYFSRVINVSATPKGKVDIELLEQDAVKVKLIKSVEYRSTEEENLGDFEYGSIQYNYLESALNEFIEIKKKYLKLNINPCFIIQISNTDKGDQQFDTIKQLLNSPAFSNLKWIGMAESDRLCDGSDTVVRGKQKCADWQKYVTPNNAVIDVLIFKMMITEGWDIPRACMLFQIRDSRSEQLNEQVVGRVRRNPKLLDFDKLTDEQQKLVTKAYVWGIRPDKAKSKQIEVKLKDLSSSDKIFDMTRVQNEIRLKITKLKKDLNAVDKEFDVSRYLKERDNFLSLANKSIFELYEDYRKANNKTQEECWKFVENHSVEKSAKYADWFSFTRNIEDIQKEIKTTLQSYENSIELVRDNNNNPIEVSFPMQSMYTNNDNYQLEVKDWVWLNEDTYSRFSFDSEAERAWIHTLINESRDNIKEIRGTLMVGKNFLPNSEIRYQYYDDGLHYS